MGEKGKLCPFMSHLGLTLEATNDTGQAGMGIVCVTSVCVAGCAVLVFICMSILYGFNLGILILNRRMVS